MYTAHAEARCQQRSISNEVVEVLLAYGESGRHQGADIYYLTRPARRRAQAALGDRYRRLERRLNSYLVVGEDGSLVTAGRRYRRLKF